MLSVGSLVKLNVRRCFTEAAGGLRMKPISNSTLDKHGLIAIPDSKLVRGERTNVVVEKNRPYLVLNIYFDEYDVSRRAVIVGNDGSEIEIEYAWLEPY